MPNPVFSVQIYSCLIVKKRQFKTVTGKIIPQFGSTEI